MSSTLSVVEDIKKMMPKAMSTVSADIIVKEFSDQSRFVKAAINGVLHEGLVAAGLTALMILLFIGSWRSTIIIAISIPLAVLCSVAVLSALGETINLMTLGGMALAVGILVDDATVEIENVHRLPTLPAHMSTLLRSKPIRRRAPRKPPASTRKPFKLELTAADVALDNAISAAAARSLALRRT
jgi:multidrug efflux pump subunit AcrB